MKTSVMPDTGRRLPFRSRHNRQAAEEALGAGDRVRAMELYARAADWPQATRLAQELGDEAKLVEYSLMGAVGEVPAAVRGNPLQAAELLAARGHHAEAIPLFERGRSFLQAGKSALAAGQGPRAAALLHQAGAWLQSARCFEEAGNLEEALHVAEEGIVSLGRTVAGTGAGAARIEELSLVRADLLLRLGRGDTAGAVLKSVPPSARAAALLERAGRPNEAFQAYLEVGLTDEASRVAARAPNRQRLLAQIYLRTGRPAEAGHLLGKLGLAREAAEAYGAAKEWAWAASRWEAAGEPLRAAEAYERAGRPRDAARCYEAGGRVAQAAEVLARSGDAGRAAAVPVRGGPAVEAARTFLAAGDTTRAASLLMPIRADDPGFADAAMLLAPLLIGEGFAEEALDRLRRLPSGLEPALDIEREYWQARSLEALGRTGEALAAYDRVLGRDAGHRDAAGRAEGLRQAERTAPAGARQPAAPRAAQAARAAARDLPVVGGILAGRYEILAEIGQGGMGTVYKARDVELDEIVAIKTVRAPEEGGGGEEARLLREVQICRRISHPNVVRVYDLGRFAGGRFVTMELIEGLRLDELIAQESPLPFARIRSLLAEIAAGLAEAHGQGVVHRDLKPSNVMVTGSRVKILDFGIASMAGLGARLTQTGFTMGSPLYMSPEQILGRDLDARSDLYSLGILAYILVTGREPYELADPSVLALKQLREPAPDARLLRPDTPEVWVQLLARLLAKKPHLRFGSAEELGKALGRLPV